MPLLRLMLNRRVCCFAALAIALILALVLAGGKLIDCNRVERIGSINRPDDARSQQRELPLVPPPRTLGPIRKADAWGAGATTLEIAPTPSALASTIVRVNLTVTPAKQLRLRVDGACRIASLDANDVWELHNGCPPCDVAATEAGIRIGSRFRAASALKIVANESPAIWINDRQYRGEVWIHRRPGNRLLVVNHVRLDHYLASVVDSEMPASFPEEARRAQAIVARSYALSQRKGHPLFDLYNTARSQCYLGSKYTDRRGRLLAGESVDSRRIVRDTCGMVCTDRGRLFCTYYSAVCGGRTTLGTCVFADAAPPLQSVECRWCREAAYFRWTRRVQRDEAAGQLRRFFSEQGSELGTIRSIQAAQGPEGEFPVRFAVADESDRHDVSAEELRRHVFPALLPSPFFTVQSAESELVFRGRGHGHGVGLCQWGARGMALAGKSCREILEHYYPGSRVTVFLSTASP